MKVCNKCHIEKELSVFNKNSRNPDRLMNICKPCRTQHRIDNREAINKYNREYKQANKEKIREHKKAYRTKHTEKFRKMMRDHYYRNKEKIRASQRKYYEKNKKDISEKQTVYQMNKYNSDPLYKLISTLRSRIRSAVKANRLTKTNKTIEMLGADIQTVRCHIESMFESWMTWDNHGTHTWHIDHIIPLSSATTIEEMEKLCHYTNLQPLAARENIIKSNKITEPQPPHAPE